jgi:hypothetical protein
MAVVQAKSGNYHDPTDFRTKFGNMAEQFPNLLDFRGWMVIMFLLFVRQPIPGMYEATPGSWMAA